MFATQDYTNGWLVYIAAAIGLLVVFWRITKGIPWSYVRHPLWITVTVFLLTPAVGHAHFLAPAWIIGILELLFTGMESFLPMVRLLLIVWLSALVLYVSASMAYYFYQKKYA